MVKIRLKRFGKKQRPFYRIVVTKARSKRQGESLEDLGSYDPIKKNITIDGDKIKYWLENGAQPSDTVKNILVKNKIIKADKNLKKFNSKPGKKAEERAAKKAEAKAAAENAKAETNEGEA